MRTLVVIFISCIFYLMSCSDREAENYDSQKLIENKFRNLELQEIYDYQNQKETEKLLPYFKNSIAIYRETAVLAFASIQDTKALNDLLLVLEKDKSEKVRFAAAFAIGQVGDSLAQNQLIRIFKLENSSSIKAQIAESIGKCSFGPGLDFILEQLKQTQNDSVLTNGLLTGLARMSIREILNQEAVELLLKILDSSNYSEHSQYLVSVSLAKLRNYDLNAYIGKLCNSYRRSKDVYTQMNIVSALSRTSSDNTIAFLDSLLGSSIDYRIKVNAIKTLSVYNYEDVNEIVLRALKDSSINVAIQASEYFISQGKRADAELYYDIARQAKNWRVRTNLITAALKFIDSKEEISSAIISGYKVSTNIYEKASLLNALGGDISVYEFINQQVVENKGNIIATKGMEALVEMRRDTSFSFFEKKWKKKHGIELSKEFAYLFKDAILSGDMAIVAIAAEIIRDPKLDFRQQFANSYFLTQALNKCKLPLELETFVELRKTIAYIDGKEVEDYSQPNLMKIDWDYICKIPYNQQVEIKTTKGDIILELYVNFAPVSVANFLMLIEEEYYNGKYIHRVVPNFVIQDGCPRGDGWGGPDYSICSEFAPIYYAEGSLGMASAGKDTESSQWFITHSPTPHLDGRYTNFGKVIQGMDIVHQLEVGDLVISIKIK